MSSIFHCQLFYKSVKKKLVWYGSYTFHEICFLASQTERRNQSVLWLFSFYQLLFIIHISWKLAYTGDIVQYKHVRFEIIFPNEISVLNIQCLLSLSLKSNRVSDSLRFYSAGFQICVLTNYLNRLKSLLFDQRWWTVYSQHPHGI